MITITTGDGKFFFSDFVNLYEEQSAEIDENALNLKELQYLLSAYNTKLDGIDEEVITLAGDAIQPTVAALWEEIGGVSEVVEDIDNQKLNIPTSVDPSTITTPTVNSLPLYTLGNNGDYVLCTPDTWLNINGFLVPGYNPTTVQG